MKVSIITTCLNSRETIEETILSVLQQTHDNIEYIIIDGGSIDGTIDIINKYRPRIATVVSEKDSGMYDAMNKGIRLATGDIVGILNSDDKYYKDSVVADIVSEFENQDVEILWGDLEVVDRKTNIVLRYWKSRGSESGLFYRGWHPPHPTVFLKREVYQESGLFRTDLGTAADFEFLLRVLEVEQRRSKYIPSLLVSMKAGGAGNKSWVNLWRANVFCYRAFRLNGLRVSRLFILLKPLNKWLWYYRQTSK